jgi:hypothetical protein
MAGLDPDSLVSVLLDREKGGTIKALMPDQPNAVKELGEIAFRARTALRKSDALAKGQAKEAAGALRSAENAVEKAKALAAKEVAPEKTIDKLANMQKGELGREMGKIRAKDPAAADKAAGAILDSWFESTRARLTKADDSVASPEKLFETIEKAIDKLPDLLGPERAKQASAQLRELQDSAKAFFANRLVVNSVTEKRQWLSGLTAYIQAGIKAPFSPQARLDLAAEVGNLFANRNLSYMLVTTNGRRTMLDSLKCPEGIANGIRVLSDTLREFAAAEEAEARAAERDQ